VRTVGEREYAGARRTNTRHSPDGWSSVRSPGHPHTTMGISGLLPNLRSVTERVPISSFRGKTVAVDAYVLLHRGAYACSRELVEGIPTEKCTNYCIRRIELLIEAGVIPFVVFDGGALPNKAEEEAARQASRYELTRPACSLRGQTLTRRPLDVHSTPTRRPLDVHSTLTRRPLDVHSTLTRAVVRVARCSLFQGRGVAEGAAPVVARVQGCLD
jgi:hypothetical protein